MSLTERLLISLGILAILTVFVLYWALTGNPLLID